MISYQELSFCRLLCSHPVFLLLIFPLFNGTFMPARNISSRDQPCGLACIYREQDCASWELAGCSCRVLNLPLEPVSVLLSASNEEGLCNTTLGVTHLAKHALQCGEGGYSPWRVGKAASAPACASGKGAVRSGDGSNIPLYLLAVVPSSTAITERQCYAAKGGQHGAPNSTKSAQWVRHVIQFFFLYTAFCDTC